MSTPATNPVPIDVIWMPEGGDQLPSGRRATRMPLPLDPAAWKPTRTAVKMASPCAWAMTFGGMVRRTRDFLAFPEGEGGGFSAVAGVVVAAGVGAAGGATSL
jgi:hypothetical protein